MTGMKKAVMFREAGYAAMGVADAVWDHYMGLGYGRYHVDQITYKYDRQSDQWFAAAGAAVSE
jgi:hypothetical protein